MMPLPMAGEPVNTMWLKGSAENTPGSASSAPNTATCRSGNTSDSIWRSVAVVRLTGDQAP